MVMKKYKDRKGINLLTLFLVIDLLAVFAIFKTSGAVYQSEAIGQTDLQVAFYAFNTTGLFDESKNEQIFNKESETLDLGDIGPGDTRVYKFKIFNTDDLGNVADTNLSYDLKIISTTNIPFEYELYYNENVYSKNASDLLQGDKVEDTIQKDEWGTYFRTIAVPEKCFAHSNKLYDYYYLKITMPENYDPGYQDLIESIKLQLTSRQVLSSDMAERGLVCRTQ